MKLFKKTAALLFCLALVFSVMAISASADDPAPQFTLKLTQTSGFTDADGSASPALQVHASPASTVEYDIYLKSTVANQSVSSLSFTIATTEGIETVAVKLWQAYDETKTEAAALETKHKDGSNNVTDTVYSYTAGGATSNANDLVLTNADTYYQVGTVSFTVNNDKDHQVVTPALENINLYVRVDDVYNANAYNVGLDSGSDTLSLHVNPVYTMTLNRFKKNLTITYDNEDSTKEVSRSGDGTKTAFATTGTSDYSATYDESNNEPTSEVRTLYYDFDGNIYSAYNSGTFETTDGRLDNARELAGYTYDGWIVTGTVTNTTWVIDADEDDDPDIVLAAGDGNISTFTEDMGKKVGDVTLEAQYTPIVYNYKFVYGNGNADTTGTYTIESVKDSANNSGAANLTPAASTFNIPAVGAQTAPEYTGYQFKGWSATQELNGNSQEIHVGYNDKVWTAYDDTDYEADSDENGNLITSATANINCDAYGDVILTAVWDEDGIFASAEYGYANSADKLMLFAVPKSNYDKKDTYTFGDGNYKAMFIVDDRYNTLFGDNLTDQKGYEIYAFIAVAADAKKIKVQITKAAAGATDNGNTTIEYQGNVYRVGETSKVINTADYGNVDALLAAGGGTAAASSLDATTMRARLEADIAKAGETAAYGATENATVPTESKYASIWDIKAIIAKLT